MTAASGCGRPEPDIHLACQNEALTNDETPYLACTYCAWRGGRLRRYECAGRLWLRLARFAAGGKVSDVLRDPTEARSDGAGLSKIHDRLPRRAHRMSLPIVVPSARSGSRRAPMTAEDHVEGLEGWFQPWNEHDLAARPFVKIGGTYTLYTGRLTEAEVATLGRLLLGLPGARPGSMGFFCDPSGGPCFEASFEPSGVTVEGQASPEQWTAWDTAFRAAVEEAKLPRFPA